jgi:hypothetical protein
VTVAPPGSAGHLGGLFAGRLFVMAQLPSSCHFLLQVDNYGEFYKATWPQRSMLDKLCRALAGLQSGAYNHMEHCYIS